MRVKEHEERKQQELSTVTAAQLNAVQSQNNRELELK